MKTRRQRLPGQRGHAARLLVPEGHRRDLLVPGLEEEDPAHLDDLAPVPGALLRSDLQGFVRNVFFGALSYFS